MKTIYKYNITVNSANGNMKWILYSTNHYTHIEVTMMLGMHSPGVLGHTIKESKVQCMTEGFVELLIEDNESKH